MSFWIDSSENAVNQLIKLLDDTKHVRLSKGYADYNYFSMPHLDKDIVYALVNKRIASIYCATKNDTIHAAVLIARHLTTAYGLLLGCDPAGYELSAPPFLWYNVIKHLQNERVHSLNLGGTTTGCSSESNLTRFKVSLGAEEYLCSGGRTKFVRHSGMKAILRSAVSDYGMIKTAVNNILHKSYRETVTEVTND